MKKMLFVFCMSVLIVGYALPTIAGVKMSGIIFTDVFYEFRDKENSSTGDDSAELNIKVPNISRLYGKWTSDNKDVGMWIELGIRAHGINKRDIVDRHACGWWQVNPLLKITAGQTVTGFSPLNPQQLLGTDTMNLNVIGGGFGDVYAGRVPTVRFTLTPNKNFQLDVAFTEPDITCVGYADVINWGKADTSLPRIDISSVIKAGPLTLYPGIMFANKTFTLNDGVADGADDSITTYAVSMAAKVNVGPVCIKGEVNVGQNWGNQDLVAIGLEHLRGNVVTDGPKKYYGAALAIGDNKIEDTQMFAGWIDAGISMGAAEIHTILGIQNYSNELNPKTDKDDFEQTTMMFGFSVPVKVAKNFKIRPEVMFYDLGERENYIDNGDGTYADQERGSYVIAGAQFQITF